MTRLPCYFVTTCVYNEKSMFYARLEGEELLDTNWDLAGIWTLNSDFKLEAVSNSEHKIHILPKIREFCLWDFMMINLFKI